MMSAKNMTTKLAHLVNNGLNQVTLVLDDGTIVTGTQTGNLSISIVEVKNVTVKRQPDGNDEVYDVKQVDLKLVNDIYLWEKNQWNIVDLNEIPKVT